jgi:hypothetical protein
MRDKFGGVHSVYHKKEKATSSTLYSDGHYLEKVHKT